LNNFVFFEILNYIIETSEKLKRSIVTRWILPKPVCR